VQKPSFLFFIFENSANEHNIWWNLHNKFQLEIHVRDCFQDLFLKCGFSKIYKIFLPTGFFLHGSQRGWARRHFLRLAVPRVRCEISGFGDPRL
jgi:hypothetical protein